MIMKYSFRLVSFLLPIGKLLSKNAKLIGPVSHIHDIALKDTVLALHHNPGCRIQIPKEERLYLGLREKYILLQIFILQNKSFSLELLLSDTSKVNSNTFYR